MMNSRIWGLVVALASIAYIVHAIADWWPMRNRKWWEFMHSIGYVPLWRHEQLQRNRDELAAEIVTLRAAYRAVDAQRSSLLDLVAPRISEHDDTPIMFPKDAAEALEWERELTRAKNRASR